MFKPVYHKENETNLCNMSNTDLKVPKNVSFIKEDKHHISNVGTPQNKLSHSRSCKNVQDNMKMLSHNEDNNNSHNSNNSSDKATKKSNAQIQQTKKKKNRFRIQKMDPCLIKTISFEKTSGRENKIKQRRKQLDKFIGYSPNYDFIRKDTTKTCT